jgi:ADP-ribosyl-[dinitrogen reductase] hydrolase
MHAITMQAVAESLLARGGHDEQDQMQRYAEWVKTSPRVPVSAELKRAAAAWQWSRRRNAGSHDPKNLDPHSLPRTAAVALYASAEPMIELAAEVSRTTQQSPVVLDLCRVWAGTLGDALHGADKRTLVTFAGALMRGVRTRQLKPPVAALLSARPTEDGPETAVGVTRVALAAFAQHRSTREIVLAAMPAGATAAALAGALAGAHYGIESVPVEWRHRLADEAALRALAARVSG